MPMKSSSQATKSSAMSSFMCCTSERSSKTIRYREQNQSKYLWLDPTRWVEKKSKREEVGILFQKHICNTQALYIYEKLVFDM